MNLLDFLAKEKMILSNSEGRRAVFQGVVKVNGEIVNIRDLPTIELNSGDIVQFGKGKMIVAT